MSAIFNAMNIVIHECQDGLYDFENDLYIEKTTIDRVKEVFKHFRVNVHDSLLELVGMIEARYGFGHSVFYYDDSLYPTEIVLIRRIVEGEIFDIELDSLQNTGS